MVTFSCEMIFLRISDRYACYHFVRCQYAFLVRSNNVKIISIGRVLSEKGNGQTKCLKVFTCKAPGKRSQHAKATHRNIVGRNMLRAFGHPVAMCYDVLGVVGSMLKMAKFEPTTPNTSQHVATGWPNAHNMLRPTMSRYVALACCDRLAGA